MKFVSKIQNLWRTETFHLTKRQIDAYFANYHLWFYNFQKQRSVNIMKIFLNYCMEAMAAYVENMDRINHPSYYSLSN